MSDLEARESLGKANALRILANTVAVGAERQKSVIQTALKRTIVDRLVDPRQTIVNADSSKLYMYYGDSSERILIHNHAINQICGVTSIPKTYVNRLLDECVGMPENARMSLLKSIFNTHLQEGVYKDRKGQPSRFLHRLMGNELWGFLSRNYNRKIGTVAMMRPFLEQCAKHGAKPTEALLSDLKTSLKCVLPTVYEPVQGEFVAFGSTYTNSDFGAGSLTVNGIVLRIASGTSSVLESKMKKIHLGAMITDSDVELSETTMDLESRTHQNAVRDMVDSVFSEENIKKTLDVVRFAADRKLPWEKLASHAKEILSKAELDKLHELLGQTKQGIIDLPPVTTDSIGDPQANAWWAAAALGIISSGLQDVERKLEIQELAGDLLK